MEFLSIPLTLTTVVVLLIGTFIGLIFGAVPGLGPPITIALMIPVLDYFSTPVALLLLGSSYVAGVYGGSISATLMNIPGTGASACTTFDGYPMSKQGRAITALSISTTASIIGGLISIAIIILATPFLQEFVLLFGSPEYFLMTVLGITTIAVASRGNLLKGLISGFFGLMLTSIGIASTTGEIRYTLGSLYLYDGVQYIPALIGIFAVTEMMRLAGRGQQISETAELLGNTFDGVRETLAYRITAIRSTLIGLFIGAVPGAGGTVANFVSYAIASSLSKPEGNSPKFGEGNPEGIVAAEASNNAMVSGSLVPSITFGIPGNSTTAVMIGALLYLGLQPGPTLFSKHLESIYTLFAGVVIGCFFLVVMYKLAPYLGRVTIIHKGVLIPSILAVSLLGTYSLRYSYGDIVQMVLFGILGYIMIRHNYSVIALLLGLILGPTAEVNLFRTLQISGGSLFIFIERLQSLLLLVVTVAILVAAFVDFNKIYQRILNRYAKS